MACAWTGSIPHATSRTATAARRRMGPILDDGSGDVLLRGCGLGRRRLGGRDRHDLPELRDAAAPIGEQRCCAVGPRAHVMLFDERAQLWLVLRRDLARDHAVGVQLAPVDQVRDAAGHARARVPAYRPEGHRRAARHVLAEMVARTFDDNRGSRVANAASLANTAGDEQATAGRAVRNRVAREHWIDRAITLRRPDDDGPSAHALADVVLRLTVEGQLDAGIDEGAEALAGAACVGTRFTASERRADGSARVV